MRKIFEEYGGVVVSVVAVVTLIAFVTFMMSSNGVLARSFGDLVHKFVSSSGELIDSAAGGVGQGSGNNGENGGTGGGGAGGSGGSENEGEQSNILISWNSTDVMDNPGVTVGGAPYLVKLSDEVLSADVLSQTTATMSGDNGAGVEVYGPYAPVIENEAGFITASYDGDGDTAGVLMVCSAAGWYNIAGESVYVEAGLYTLNWAALYGLNVDTVVEYI